MAKKYFFFKPLRVERIGGIMPDNVETISYINEYYVGATDEEITIKQLDHHIIMPLTQEEAEGVKYIGLDQYAGSVEEIRPLTSDEITKRDAAINAYKKVYARPEINYKIQDIEDWIADIFKLIGLLLKYLYENNKVSEDLYNVVSNYLSRYDSTTLPSKIQSRLDMVNETLNLVSQQIDSEVRS